MFSLFMQVFSSSLMITSSERDKGRDDPVDNRAQKVLSLFQIVNFPNSECVSEDGDAGVCMTSGECLSRSGLVSGSCAQGFGACCLVYHDQCGGTLEHNNTYIRFDFDVMSIAAPDSTTSGSIGQCTTDYFQGTNAKTGTTRTSGKVTPAMCGVNDGQHIYVDAGANTADSAVLAGEFKGTTTARKWKIKVGQIPCDSVTNPRFGCLQYHTGTTGTVRSFNFLADSGSYLHLANQFYRVCVRRAEKYCAIAWSQCSDTDSFKISRPSTNYKSATGNTGCGSDAVKIFGGSNYGQIGSCATPPATTQYTVDRYCGGSLNCQPGVTSKSVIMTSTVPFDLEVEFSNTDLLGTNNRGFCLNYYQILC